MATSVPPIVPAMSVEDLSNKFFSSPRPGVLTRFRRNPNNIRAMQITVAEWGAIFCLSLFVGVGVYCVLIAYSYFHTAHAMQSSQATFTLPWKPGLPTDTAADLLLGDLGIDAEPELKAELISAMAAAGSPKSYPALGIATQLIRATNPGSCSTCDGDCSKALEPVITRILLGWPTTAAGRTADLAFLHKRTDLPSTPGSVVVPSQAEKDEACRTSVASLESLRPSVLSPALLVGRQEPWPAPLVAQLVLGAPTCLSAASPSPLTHDRCVLVTRLFQTVIDDADVKRDRSLLVDFFYGWERALVCILVFIVALAILRQRRARERLELEAGWLQGVLNNAELKRGLDPIDPRETISARDAAIALRNSFLTTFAPTEAIPAQGPVAEIVVATAEAVDQKDLNYLQTFVDRNLSEMESSRELINSLITLFPVIGFSATLLSLVNALAGANQIATSSGDLRSAAILNVTSLLSSCFATTFLALVSMAVFVLINLLESGADRRLVTILSERLISTFRPGRSY